MAVMSRSLSNCGAAVGVGVGVGAVGVGAAGGGLSTDIAGLAMAVPGEGRGCVPSPYLARNWWLATLRSVGLTVRFSPVSKIISAPTSTIYHQLTFVFLLVVQSCQFGKLQVGEIFESQIVDGQTGVRSISDIQEGGLFGLG